jgi:diguanylate cyclase (GGDEF)-like protein
MSDGAPAAELLEFVLNRLDIGIVAVDRELRVVVWNHFLEAHSGRAAADVLGRPLFDAFPELPCAWLTRKINAVTVLKNFSFTSWRQRPYLFKFRHHRPITGGIEVMRQDCTFLPIMARNQEVIGVCITIVDATETCMYQTKLDEALAVIAEQSIRDPMTGVYNRRKLEQEIASEIVRAVRYKRPLSMLMLDIDHFKRVNDTLGHLAGDEVIRHVAKLAATSLRKSDLVGRYGGEEFGILLPEVAGDGALIVAERIRSSVAASPASFDGRSVPVTISLGAAQLRMDGSSTSNLVAEADEALYASKKSGRNRVTLCQPTQQP